MNPLLFLGVLAAFIIIVLTVRVTASTDSAVEMAADLIAAGLITIVVLTFIAMVTQ